MKLTVTPDGWLSMGERRYRCALGKAGVTRQKREGDMATPAGCFPLRRLLYRADRHPPPETGLPMAALTPGDGWCDDANDPLYNRPVRLPYSGHAEDLMRADALYDFVVVVGYNDDPVTPGKGSAIFLHIAAPDYAGTEGCVAVTMADMLEILAGLTPESRIDIRAD